jgi:acetylglutamate kinase
MFNQFKKFYSKIFRDQLFIIKAGGRIITDKMARENLIKNVQELTNDGINVLLIYGGGEAIDVAMHEAGLTPTKIDGRRISSNEDIKIIKKVLAGDLGFKISETCVKLKLPSTVLNAIPPHWTNAKRRSKKDGITRFDGVLNSINKKNIWSHFSSTNLAIVPCLAFTKDGTALNINADNVAIELACETKANKLILMTDIDGVMVDKKVQFLLTVKDIEKLIKEKIVTDGMKVKLENCMNALKSGVRRVHILNGFKKDTLRDEIYTSRGIGTMIVRDKEKQNYLSKELQKQN